MSIINKCPKVSSRCRLFINKHCHIFKSSMLCILINDPTPLLEKHVAINWMYFAIPAPFGTLWANTFASVTTMWCAPEEFFVFVCSCLILTTWIMFLKFNSDDLQIMLPHPFMAIERAQHRFKSFHVAANVLVQVVFDLFCWNVLWIRII